MFKFNFGAANNDGLQQGPSTAGHDEAEAYQAKEIPMSDVRSKPLGLYTVCNVYMLVGYLEWHAWTSTIVCRAPNCGTFK